MAASLVELRECVDRIARHDWCASLTRDSETRLSLGEEPDAGGRSWPIVTVARRPIDEWWVGFADALHAVACDLDLPTRRSRPDAVVVVGLPLDRLEPDRIADRDEIARLLQRALDLEVVSVWPSGLGCESLRRAAEAGIVVSLPHGREAGRTLARRTGATLIEAGLPVGLGGAIRFVREVGRAVGRDPEPFIQRQTRRYAPRLEWLIPHALLHRRVRVEVDPWMTETLTTFLTEVGCRVAGEERPDLVIGPRTAVERAAGAGLAFLEKGFPSPGHHALYPNPAWFGFEGAMGLVEDIANRLTQWETVERARRMRGL